MSRWDREETPRRRFNPLDLKTIGIGTVVFLLLSLGFFTLGLK